MIKGINSSGKYLTVTGGTSSNPYISPGSVGAGMMRYNPNMNCIEVNDGNSWKTLEMSYATVDLNADAESLLQWAREQRDKQWVRESKMKSNPALKKAYEAILRAEENYDLLESIAGDYNEESGVTQSP
jgi:hypothetical protein